MDGAPGLTGTSVLELTAGLAGAYCGRLLAMLGADVVKFESPTRPDEARAAGSGLDRFLHAEKRSLALDVATADGDDVLSRLAADADIVLDDGALGAPPAVRDRYDGLLASCPHLVLVAISPFGLEGPRAAWQATELTELAAGGWLSAGPHGATPLMPGPASALYSAGTLAALGALLALRARRRTGRGQLVEVPMNEALVHMLTAPTTVFSFSGVDLPRMGDGFPYGIYRCADGYLGVNVLTQNHWTGLCRLMGREDLIDDPRYRTGLERADPATAAELDVVITEWAARQPANATFHAAQATRTPVTIVPSPTEVLDSPQYAARGYWVDDEAEGLGRFRLPGPPFKLASGALAAFRPARPIGADTDDVLATISPPRRQHRHGVTSVPPLDGVRVLDLTAWQAGPLATMILGDFGADVIKIEAPRRLDGWRGGAGMEVDRAYERNPLWNTINRSKRGLSLDLASDAGRRLFLRLVEDADVVVENFTPRVLDNLALGFDELRAVNPRIILASLSGFGQTGPWRDYVAFAFPTECVSGLASLTGERGGPPTLMGASVTDAMVAAMGAFAIVAALERRERSGAGDAIDLSQIETLTTFIAGELVRAALTGADAERVGNDRPGLCPHGLYPCRPEGQLLAVAVRGDADWRHLCDAIGRLDLAADPLLATAAGRERERSRVDEAVTAWSSTVDGATAAALLQEAGVPAAVAVRPSQLAVDEQLWARDFYRVLEREEVGAHPYPGAVVRLTATPAVIERPAPLYGQHTDEVLGGLLGLGEDDLRALRAEGVTSTEPLAQDWR